MEKDVLLEYASVGHLFVGDRTQQMRDDSKKMGLLYHEISKTNYTKIDFEEMVSKIKAIRGKYEKR